MDNDQKKQLLAKRRTTLLASLGRAEQFVEEYVAERDAPQVRLRLNHLDTVWMKLEEVQTELEDIEETSEGMQQNVQFRSSFETKLFKIKAALQLYLPPLPSLPSAIPHSAISGLSGIKLPTISLPEFDGDYNQWLAFHDTFAALIHSNQEVPDIQKFHYLRAAVRGEAAKVIESIEISSANYSIAWQTLKSRFANDYLLKKRHLQALLDCPRMKKESSDALHSVVDEYERHTKTLRQLGEPIDSWSTMLEHLLCLRLDDSTLKAWEDYATTVDNPDFKCLIEFLQRRIRVLESITVNHQSQPAPSTSYQAPPPFRKPQFHRVTTHAAAETPQFDCYACDQQHPLFRCPRFEEMTLSDRLGLVTTHRLCHNCFHRDHFARNCRSNYSCRHCKKRHHSLLHPGFNPTALSHRPNEAQQSSSIQIVAAPVEEPEMLGAFHRDATSTNSATFSETIYTPVSNSNVLLSTVVLMVIDCCGKAHPARALLDNGSQSNIISERLCQLLKLKRNKINIPVYGIGESSSRVHHSVRANIRSRKNGFKVDVDLLVMPRITIDLPVITFPVDKWHIPQDLFLADPNFNQTGAIDMLLGAEHFLTFLNPGNKIDLGHMPVLVDSVFGWIVTGRNDFEVAPPSTACTSCLASLADPLHEALERFWRIEEIENHPNFSLEEQQCESHYATNFSRTSEGRYTVRLPRHADFDHMLGESSATALRRFRLLEKRLDKEPALKLQYHEFLSEYVSLGHMKLVPPNENEPTQTHYLPHHPVIKDSSTTTKVRVVFDGSAKTSTGHSLNDALQVGPIIQDELLTLILRFRKYPIALVADIAKMYRQVLLHPQDTPLQRIFWRFNTQNPISTYELQTVTYGLAPSSFLATRTLQQLVKDEGADYSLGRPALQKGFYVDDYIGGAQTVEEAIRTRIELDELLSKGGFQLRKWSSNSLEVLKGLDSSQIGTQSSLKFDPEEAIKTLGISWEPEADKLRFDSSSDQGNDPPTKRSILSFISKHFDPLGLTAPVIIRAKMLLQELWMHPCGWDDEVPDSIRNKWENYCSDLPAISSYRVDRYAFMPNSTVQLHTFADASEQAYGACIYARSVDPDGQVRVQLIASKSRVAPLKRLSIPRLELSAALLGARLYKKAIDALDMPISAHYFWSDSSVTLEWLRSPPNTWKTFIANRVSEIQNTTQGSYWNHVAGIQNPADLVSRGMKVDDFLGSDLWHNGPSWLMLSEDKWPVSVQQASTPDDILERRSMVAAAVQTHPSINPIFERSSSYSRLLRVIAFCLRFITKCLQPRIVQPVEDTTLLTVEEIESSRKKLVTLCQADNFAQELRDLRKGNPVSKHSPLRLLRPFLDAEGILRVGGRLNFSELSYLTKHPILLPSSHPFTQLVARYYHLKFKHGGGRATLAAMRQEYWPINGKRLTSTIVRKCFRCNRASPVPAQQQTGQLPIKESLQLVHFRLQEWIMLVQFI